MSEDKKTAEYDKPLTEEELQAVVGGVDFIDLDPSNPTNENPTPPAPDPGFPSDLTSHLPNAPAN